MQRICGPSFWDLFMSFERFCQPACFFAVRFTLRQPKTPVGNALNLRTLCFEDYHYAFQALSRDSLSCVTRSLDLCILFKFIFFIPLILSAPFLRFSHVILYTNFFWRILPREIFFLSLMTLLLEINYYF